MTRSLALNEKRIISLLPLMTLVCLTLNLPCMSFAFAEPRPGDMVQEKEAKELFGKVVDEAGKPLAGAQVFWANFTGDETSTSSKADGRFQIQLKMPTRVKTHYFLWVYLPGYNLKAVQPLLGDQLVRDCTVKLQKSQTLVVQVLDENGSTCSGATLTPRHFDVPNGVFDTDKSTGLVEIVPAGIAKLLSANANESGNAILRGLKKEFLRSINVKYRDLAVQTHSGGFNLLRCKIQLAPVATIRGKINVDDLGPLAERKLRISTKCPNPKASANDPFSVSDGPNSFVECEVAPDGSFEAKNIGAGAFSINFVWDANCPKQLKTPEQQRVAPGEELFVSLETADAVKVTGKLIKEDTEEPVTSCRVSINFGPKNRDRLRRSHSVESDENGRFQAYVFPGEVDVQTVSVIEAYDYPQQLKFNVVAGNEPTTIPPLIFSKQAEAKVLVVDANDRPLPNRAIGRLFGDSSFTIAQGVTDEHGVATVKFRRSREPVNFSGQWFIAENEQTGGVDLRKLPRLTLKQSSPPILQYKKRK